MGSAASVLKFKKEEVMTVDPPGPGWRSVKTFSRAIFKKYEWETLKVFCQKYKIAQRDLVRVFFHYLSGDEAYVRDFQVRAIDARNKFGKYSKLFQELADVFIPALYFRNFVGLQPVLSGENVSFARFIINSYIFGCQHFPDLIYDFFSVLRQKLDVQTTVVISPFSISKIVSLLTEEFEESGTLRTLKQGMKRLEQGPDMRLHAIIHMGVKYPLMFYVIERFRKLYKRLVFGDRFWKDRKFIKLRHIEVDGYLDEDLDVSFTTIEVATRRTALSIIADALAMNSKEKAWFPNDTFRVTPTVLNSAQVTSLKSFLGYKSARAVLLESGISLDFNASFLQSHLAVIPVQSPPSKTLPVSPWADSEGQDYEGEGDRYSSLPSSPNHPAAPAAGEGGVVAEGNNRSIAAEFPLVGYDVDDAEYRNRPDSAVVVAAGDPATSDTHAADPAQQQQQQSADDYLRSQLFPATLADNDEGHPAVPTNVVEGDREGVLMVRDTQFGRDFRYDVHTGRARWLQLFIDTDGEVLREVYY